MVNPTLWYESTLNWGIITLCIAFFLGAMAMMSPNIKSVILLLAITWLLSITATWLIVKSTSLNKYKVTISIFEALIMAGFLYLIYHPSTELTNVTTNIIQPPSVGNLKQRAYNLADEIMEDLYTHGWRPMFMGDWKPRHPLIQDKMPDDEDGNRVWAERRSRNFKHRFYERTIELKNEFAQLHYSDHWLDEYFKNKKMQEDANNQLKGIGKPQREIYFMPQEIEKIAMHIRKLSEQIK